MQFALNYSPQAGELLQAGAIQIDRFKCPNWPDLVQDAQALAPVYIHFDLLAGRGRLELVDWNAIERTMIATETPYVNLHLAALVGDLPDIQGDPLTPSQRERVIDRMRADVQLVVQRFGGDRVIVENIPYLDAEDSIMHRRLLRACVEPEVISAILDEANCGLLFDLSHACITADTLGMDARAYIEALPLHRMRELHVTGIEMLDGRLEDHLAMTEQDWEMLDWFMGKIAAGEAAEPWMVAFEYGGITKIFDWRSKPEVIASQVPRLYSMVHRLQTSNEF